MCVGNDIKKNLVDARCSDVYFQETQNGYKIKIKPYTGERLEEIKNKAIEEEKLLEVSTNKKRVDFINY